MLGVLDQLIFSVAFSFFQQGMSANHPNNNKAHAKHSFFSVSRKEKLYKGFLKLQNESMGQQSSPPKALSVAGDAVSEGLVESPVTSLGCSMT